MQLNIYFCVHLHSKISKRIFSWNSLHTHIQKHRDFHVHVDWERCIYACALTENLQYVVYNELIFKTFNSLSTFPTFTYFFYHETWVLKWKLITIYSCKAYILKEKDLFFVIFCNLWMKKCFLNRLNKQLIKMFSSFFLILIFFSF